jgi:RNA polymerase sigma factor (sigma-70 family)
MNGLPMAPVLPVVLLGNPASRLSSLFDSHHDRLYRLARRLVPDADDALDLVQETFLKAARSPTSVPLGLTSEEAWLVRVLINIRRDQWRKETVRARHAKAMSRATAVGGSNPEAILIARTTVWRALDTLTPRRRAVVVMYELEGLTIAAIASLLGLSAITVRWHLSVGRRELARILRPQMGETNEDHD